MSDLPEGWLALRAEAGEFLRDLTDCAACASVDLDHLDGNLYYMRLGRAAGRVERYLKTNSADQSALSFVVLHRELITDQPTGPESSSLPDHMYSSAQKLERRFLEAVLGPPLSEEAVIPFEELSTTLSDTMKQVGYEEVDRETAEVEAVHAIDPARCFGVGRRLAYLEEYLSEKNYGSALELAEERLPGWLDQNCPQYLKDNDDALRNFIINISKLYEEEDGL